MKTTSERYINASKDVMATIARLFDVTEKYVYLCLTYRKNNETARKIRYTAVEHYGAIPMCHYPECETLHNTSEDGRQFMVQNFDNGVTLRVDKRTGEAWITNRRGATVVHKQCISIPQLSEIQVLAENM